MSRTKCQNEWRKRNTEKRNISRKRNYVQTAGPEKNQNHGSHWTVHEMRSIMHSCFSDRELHHFFGRSIQAIQVMRHRLLKQ